MIFEKVFCHISERQIFKFNSIEILPNIYIAKKFKRKSDLFLLDSFESNHLNFERGSKYYTLKSLLFNEFEIPLFIFVKGYEIQKDNINSQVQIFCYEEDTKLIKEKAAF